MSVPERIVKLLCNLDIEGAPAFELDQQLEAAVRNAVRITDTRVEYRNDSAWHERVWSLVMKLESSGPPVDLALGAVVTVPATTQDFGFDQKIFLPHGVGRQLSLRTGWYLEPHDLGGDEVRVTLYTDAANSPLGTTRVWGRPLTFEKIPVQH